MVHYKSKLPLSGASDPSVGAGSFDRVLRQTLLHFRILGITPVLILFTSPEGGRSQTDSRSGHRLVRMRPRGKFIQTRRE